MQGALGVGVLKLDTGAGLDEQLYDSLDEGRLRVDELGGAGGGELRVAEAARLALEAEQAGLTGGLAARRRADERRLGQKRGRRGAGARLAGSRTGGIVAEAGGRMLACTQIRARRIDVSRTDDEAERRVAALFVDKVELGDEQNSVELKQVVGLLGELGPFGLEQEVE